MHGIQMPNPSRVEDYECTDYDFLKEKVEFMRKNAVEYIMFVTTEKRDPVHGKFWAFEQAHLEYKFFSNGSSLSNPETPFADTMKLLEVDFKLATQHLHMKTLLKAISNRGAEMTLDNLIMKMNLKLGGITHALATSMAFMNKNRINRNLMWDF